MRGEDRTTQSQCRVIWKHTVTENSLMTCVLRAFGVLNIGKNGITGRQIPFNVLPIVPLVPMYQSYRHKSANNADKIYIKSHDSIWLA